MFVRQGWLLWLFSILLILGYAKAEAKEDKWGSVDCSEWANFTKIITYKFRETYAEDAVIAELSKVQNGNPDLPIAVNLVHLTYYKKDISPVDIWHIVYDQCMHDRSI